MLTIKALKGLLKSQKKQLKIIKDDLAALVKKYGDDRRTDIAPDAAQDIDEEDLVPDRPILTFYDGVFNSIPDNNSLEATGDATGFTLEVV